MVGSRGAPGVKFILVTLFLDVLGIGIIIPVLPHLATDLLGGDASRAASYYGAIASSYALMQFLFSPMLGALSDQVGRRPIVLLSLFGFGVNYLILGFAPSLTWFIVARILSGICGASITTCNAYIADVSDSSNRAQNFGLVGATFGLGFIFGPALGGVLGYWGPRVPFFVSAGIVAINWAYGLLVLPESLAPEHRRRFTWREANPIRGLLRLRSYPTVAGLALAFVFVGLAQRGLETIWVLSNEYRFGWQELQNGLTLGLVGVTAAFVQGYLIRRIMPRLGERRALVAGLAVMILGFVLYGLATSGWMMLVIIVITSFGGIAGPAIQSLVTGTVSASEQGAVQGSLASILSLTSILAPLIASQLFRFYTSPEAPLQVPGAPFFAGALFAAMALVTVLYALRRERLGTDRA